MKIKWLFILPTLFLSGCNKDSPLAPNKSQLVVRGYLYAGEPVSDIRLTTTLPLGSEETQAPPVNNAEVALYKSGIRYDLVPSPGDSGYYHYSGTNLSVQSGDVFQIQVWYQNQMVKASTIVPPSPENVTLDKSTLTMPSFSAGEFPPFQGNSMDSLRKSMSLTVTWQQETDALYYVVVKNLENNPVAVETRFMGRARMFMTPPMPSAEYDINAGMLTYYGKHEVRVYRVNQEYADLYQSRTQDSRDLNEPLTNIENGLGVFSAFNSSSAAFTFTE